MFNTSTSTVGSLFDLMKSTSPSTVSPPKEVYDSAARKIRSGAPSLVSKSPGSIASFNSSNRYQPSSCSTYSASPPAVSSSSSNIFKRQYIHQAIRLVDDALTEQDKGSCCDESYALDCYLASLEYLLSAVSSEATLHRQIGTVDRQALVHAKLNNLLRKTEEFSCLSDKQDESSNPKASSNGWWNGVWKKSSFSQSDAANHSVFPSEATDLAAQCDCGRMVLVKIPEGFLSNPNQSNPPENELDVKPRKHLITRCYRFIMATIFSIIGFIKGTVIPYLLTFLLTTTLSFVVFMEKRFQVVNLLLGSVIAMIKILLKISQDYQFNQQIGNFVSWLISHLVQLALAFVKREDLNNLTQLFNLDINETHGPKGHQDDYEPKRNSSDIRLKNLFTTQAEVLNQPTLNRTSASSFSSSRISGKSNSTFQDNRGRRNVPNSLHNKSSHLSSFRTNSNGF